MSAPAALADAIDLERYPIDDLDAPAARTRSSAAAAVEHDVERADLVESPGRSS